jgi:cysteinyl-tRNA synthetase
MLCAVAARVFRRGLSTQAGIVRVFDSLSRAVTPLPPRGEQTWYVCGPTVYDAAHLGHARTYIAMDLLRRVATRFCKQPVRFLMGVTDVDDKIINRAPLGESAGLARYEEAQFFEAMAALNVEPPTTILRVTEFMPSIVRSIQELWDGGFAYLGEDGVYFSVGALEASGIEYCRLRPSVGEHSEAGSSSGKRDSRDFALWKAAKEGEPSWESPWGAGRPGWHIECSAMTLEAGGEHLELHAGGSDLCFPHHANEMAQSEAILASRASKHGGPRSEWVGAWVHPGPLTIQGMKMSKSLKNFVTVKELLAQGRPSAGTLLSSRLQGCDPADVFRLYCLMQPYRSVMSYSEEGMGTTAGVLARWHNLLKEFQEHRDAARVSWGERETALWRVAEGLRGELTGVLADDLDGPAAVRVLSGFVEECFDYLHHAESVNPFVLFRAAQALADVGGDLGFRSLRVDWKPVNGPGWESFVGPEAKVAITGELLQEFRDQVRKIAATSVGSRSEGGKALLELCDVLRDHVGPARAPWVTFRDTALKSVPEWKR